MEGPDFKIQRYSGSGDGCGSQTVDSGLDDHVGEREDHALDTGRDSDLQYLKDQAGMPVYLADGKVQNPCFLRQEMQDQYCTDCIGDDGGDGHSVHVHATVNNEEYIQRYIDQACQCQADQRLFCISVGPKDGCAKIIDCQEWDAEIIYFQIQICHAQDLRRGTHQTQDGSGEQKAERSQYDSENDRKEQGGMDCFPCSLFIFFAYQVGDDNSCPYRGSHQAVDENVDDGGCASHCGQGLAAGIAADYSDIRGIEQLLE